MLDNGKNASHYTYGVRKLNVTTKAANGVKFTTKGEQDDAGKIDASVAATMDCKKMGLTFTEKWSSSNAIDIKAVAKNVGTDGVKVTVKGKFDEGAKAPISGSVDASFANDLVAGSLEIKADSGAQYCASEVNGNVSLGQSGFVGGVKGGYSLANGAKPVDVKLGYATNDFQATFLLNKNFTEFGVNYHQAVNDKLAVAAQIDLKDAPKKDAAAAAGASSVPKIEVGAVYKCCKGTTYRVKVDSDGNLGTVYGQDISDNISVAFAFGLDLGQALNSGAAGKAGFSLNFNA